MSVAFRSVAYSSWGNNVSSIQVDKPTNLAAGDLMVAHIGLRDSAGGRTIDVVSGWTDSGEGEKSQTISGNDHIAERVIYKVASSADASAANFTFTVSGGSTLYLAASIYAVSGPNPNDAVDFSSSAVGSGSTSGSAGNGGTPTYTDTLYLMLTCVRTAGAVETISGYTLATSNPSWTEDYDFNSASGQPSISGAHAIRSQITDTGAASFTLDVGPGASAVYTGILVVLKNTSATTITAVSGGLTLAGGSNLVKTGVKIIATAGSLLLSGGTHLIKRLIQWTNSNKSSDPTFTNSSKSSSTWTNESKSSDPTFTNENKTSL